jgi:hypothetical protein
MERSNWPLKAKATVGMGKTPYTANARGRIIFEL